LFRGPNHPKHITTSQPGTCQKDHPVPLWSSWGTQTSHRSASCGQVCECNCCCGAGGGSTAAKHASAAEGGSSLPFWDNSPLSHLLLWLLGLTVLNGFCYSRWSCVDAIPRDRQSYENNSNDHFKIAQQAGIYPEVTCWYIWDFFSLIGRRFLVCTEALFGFT